MKTVSIWQEEFENVREWPDVPEKQIKSLGRNWPKTPLYVARQKANDYYRQFTQRETPFGDDDEVVGEALPDSILLGESNYLDANLSPESRALFNDLVRQLLFNFVKEFEEDQKDIRKGFASKYVSRLIRMSRLDEILDQDLQDKIQENLGDNNPWKIKDLAPLTGFWIREGGRTPMEFETHCHRVKSELRIFAKTMI